MDAVAEDEDELPPPPHPLNAIEMAKVITANPGLRSFMDEWIGKRLPAPWLVLLVFWKEIMWSL
jgi:hypothetical protein